MLWNSVPLPPLAAGFAAPARTNRVRVAGPVIDMDHAAFQSFG